MLTTLTNQERKAIKENPLRIKEVNKEIEAMGTKILSQYALFGSCDFVNILGAKNNKIVSKRAVELGTRGTLQTLPMAGMTFDESTGNL